MTRVLVCGGRTWTADQPIQAILEACQPDSVVIHGGARGADRTAGRVAKGLGLTVEVYPAEWDRLGRLAGLERNQVMLRQGRPDIVWAFKDSFDWLLRHGGTEHMVRIATKAEVPCFVVSHIGAGLDVRTVNPNHVGQDGPLPPVYFQRGRL